jgi:OOP family OmpA-OmpF porin
MKKLILIPTLLTASLVMAKSTFEVTPQVGYNFAGKDTNLKNYAMYGGEVQYNGFNFPIKPELSFYYSLADYEDDFENYVNNADTNVMRFSVNGVYEFNKISYFVPSVKIGAGYETMDSDYGGNREGSGFADGGLGVKIPFSDMISFKLETIYMLKYNAARYDNNYVVLAGINFVFGKSSESEKEQEINYDVDNDGVLDSLDKCLSTPQGMEVDDNGCTIEKKKEVQPIDSDNDGVIDLEDLCAETPIGIKVDTTGCKLHQDSDKDGVEDINDNCEDTPLGIKVDTSGCEIDTDVDKDGVLDSQDDCLNTPIGMNVDTKGCKIKNTINLKDIVIRFGYKYEGLTEESKKSLNQLNKILHDNPELKINILGYADSIGSKEYNLKLSQKRAYQIEDMLIEKGISADRLNAIGKGEANPIATNMYKAGRAQNRRIEIEAAN